MTTTSPRGGRRRWFLFLRDLLVIVLLAVVASFLIKTFLVRSFYIPSESMENTLQIGDRVLVNELVGRVVPIQRGDVIVFRDPGGWLEGAPVPAPAPSGPVAAAGEWVLSLAGLSVQDSNDHLIKRVIGLPGDRVQCCNALGQLSVNGVPLNEPYVKHDLGDTAASDQSFIATVPRGDLWVMGDNRDHSCDSRCHITDSSHGYLPESDVVGRAFVTSWPISHWTVLSNHADTFTGIPAPG